MLDPFFVVAVAYLKSTVKNKAKKKALKHYMLEIFNLIRGAYPGDKDFE